MKVVCINDAGRPNEIPVTHWIKRGAEYTVINSIKCNVQGQTYAYVLAEVDISDFQPYCGFNAERFTIAELAEVVAGTESRSMAEPATRN